MSIYTFLTGKGRCQEAPQGSTRLHPSTVSEFLKDFGIASKATAFSFASGIVFSYLNFVASWIAQSYDELLIYFWDLQKL